MEGPLTAEVHRQGLTPAPLAVECWRTRFVAPDRGRSAVGASLYDFLGGAYDTMHSDREWMSAGEVPRTVAQYQQLWAHRPETQYARQAI